jgi:hypothetical protein
LFNIRGMAVHNSECAFGIIAALGFASVPGAGSGDDLAAAVRRPPRHAGDVWQRHRSAS